MSSCCFKEWDLVENFQGVLEYQTRYSKFQNMDSITLHFPDSFGGDTTKSTLYTGFKGEATQLKRDVVATIVYELTGQILLITRQRLKVSHVE
ncbi:hypothetical protein ACE6H2_003341 [Prunus campanulata]